VNAASFASPIAPGAFTSIFGSGLAATTRTWTAADFSNGKLPTALDGVTVTIDGKPAYVYYISPSQVDVIGPPDQNIGAVQVTVANNAVAAPLVPAQLQGTSPAFFVSGKYPIATHANGSFVGPVTLFPGNSTPAGAGEKITLYGTGFGPTNPLVDGLVVASPASIANPPAITIGGETATAPFVGLVSAGLFQLNITIPLLPAKPAGAVDVPISAAAGGSSTQANIFVTVQ
jgi:uncharacterized protein (TIGR03437 family)